MKEISDEVTRAGTEHVLIELESTCVKWAVWS